jgi:hypothetical protein
LPPTEVHDDTPQAPPDPAHTDARLPDTEALFADNTLADER